MKKILRKVPGENNIKPKKLKSTAYNHFEKIHHMADACEEWNEKAEDGTLTAKWDNFKDHF